MDKPEIYDQNGQEQDWSWLIANFGAVNLERAEAAEGVGQVYRIVKLVDSEGPAVTVVNVADQEGKPLENVRVVRYWPDAPLLPGWSPPASRWRDRGVYGGTNIRGDIGFGMGRGDFFSPPNRGASALWVSDEQGPSDFIEGLGMLGGTNHRHLNVFFQLQDEEAGPPPPPPPEEKDNWDKLFERVDRIIDLLEEMSS